MATAEDWLTNNAGLLASLGLGGLVGSMNGSQQAGTTTTTNAPWSPQQPYLLDLFQRAQNQSQNPATSDAMNSAFSGMQNAVGSALPNQAQGVIGKTLSIDPSKYFGIGATNPYLGKTTPQVSNPYLGAQAATATNPLSTLAANTASNPFIGSQAATASNPFIGQQATTYNAATANNPYLGIDNPYLSATIDAASQDAMRNIMPAYDQAQAASGSFGNSGVADYFGRAAANTLGNIATNARMGQFQQNQNLAQNQGQFNAGQLNAAGATNAGATNTLAQNNANLAQNLGLANAGAVNAMTQANMGAAGALGQFNASALNSQQAQNQSLAQQLAQYNATNAQNQGQFNANLAQNLGLANAGLTQTDLTRNAQLAQTGIGNDIGQYNQGMSVLNNAAFNAPQFGTANLNNYGTLYNAAALQNNAQWNPLNNYSNLIRGTYGGTSSQPYYNNPVSGAIGGALLGGSLFGGLSGA